MAASGINSSLPTALLAPELESGTQRDEQEGSREAHAPRRCFRAALPRATVSTAPGGDHGVTVRPIDFARDRGPLKSFLSDRDGMRLDHAEAAVRDGDCFIMVADEGGMPIGWAVVHTKYREDQDWEPDPQGRAFQEGDNAYLENIEVTARARSRGAGSKLLAAVQEEARRRGKKFVWLHTNENNVKAHKVFDREGWQHDSTVYPPWKPASRTRIYKKTL